MKTLRVVTLNIHKGLSQFNRRMVIHELRDGLRGMDPDLVFLQEVQGLNQRFAMRFATCPVAPQHEFLAGQEWQHLSLHERGRSRQLEAISGRLEELASRDLPIIVAGDFNDWRHRATAILERRLGMTEVSVAQHGRAVATYPSVLPLLRLDRIYVRGFKVAASQVHRGKPWSLLSDHLAVSAELERA